MGLCWEGSGVHRKGRAVLGRGLWGGGVRCTDLTPPRRCGARLVRWGSVLGRLFPQVLSAWSGAREAVLPGQEKPFRYWGGGWRGAPPQQGWAWGDPCGSLLFWGAGGAPVSVLDVPGQLGARGEVWGSLGQLEGRGEVWESLGRLGGRGEVWGSLGRLGGREEVWRSLGWLGGHGEVWGSLRPP